MHPPIFALGLAFPLIVGALEDRGVEAGGVIGGIGGQMSRR